MRMLKLGMTVDDVVRQTARLHPNVNPNTLRQVYMAAAEGKTNPELLAQLKNQMSPEEYQRLEGVLNATAPRTGGSTGTSAGKPPKTEQPQGQTTTTPQLQATPAPKPGQINPNIRVPGVVRSRINIANGQTRFTPLRDNGNQVAAGLDHVVARHFQGKNTQSRFSISVNNLKELLRRRDIVQSPISITGQGDQVQFVRTVNTGQVIGTVRLSDGGVNTTWLKIYTDRAGNLITTFPVPAPK
jgi:filamentous hemagglutinin